MAAGIRRPRRARAAVTARGTGALTALCLHGLGVSPRHLAPLIQVLRRDREVVAPHLPQGLRIEQLAGRVLSLLRERVAIFANSLGCQVAVEVAFRAPELVDALVLVGPTADPRAPTLRAQFARLGRDSLQEPLRLNWVVASDYVRNGPLRTLRGARFMLEHPLRGRLPLVGAPTVVVRRERDPIVSQAWAEEVARLLPAGRLHVVRGAAHCAHYTHPEEVATAVSAGA